MLDTGKALEPISEFRHGFLAPLQPKVIPSENDSGPVGGATERDGGLQRQRWEGDLTVPMMSEPETQMINGDGQLWGWQELNERGCG